MQGKKINVECVSLYAAMHVRGRDNYENRKQTMKYYSKWGGLTNKINYAQEKITNKSSII